ncbi:YcxB family protein [Streptomyces sp. NPDC048330]|uniref:YcxB family protein n=1 Tax=Streptomyces sp. NPDC048330 TaxID=3365533 RepID=UPI003718D7F8
MAEGQRTGSTDEGLEAVDDTEDGSTAVHLVYLPQPADTLVGLRVRGRIKRTGLLRGVFLTLWTAQWLLPAVGRGRVDGVSTVLFLGVLALVWGYPRLQAAQVQRTVGWQGEYRATVSPAGISCRNDHSTLIQSWSVFRGYRETAGHFVLMSRDPHVMCLDVLPKRGLRGDEEVERLRTLLDRHTARV